MKHRNLSTSEWSRMAIDNLFEDGTLSDWKEFVSSMRKDPRIARDTLYMCDHHVNKESATLARVLVDHFYGSNEDMGLR
ncbi:MAG: hypothetical protein HOP17_16850 [Acidobacteria bacterium]|nr:hypothetical protein [Acidobacteriota bacterium]